MFPPMTSLSEVPRPRPILITGYLGPVNVAESALYSIDQRRVATVHALRVMCRVAAGHDLFVAITGAEDEFRRLTAEVDGLTVTLGWFRQEPQQAVRGKGYLEARLVQAALRRWSAAFDDGLVLKLTAKYHVENFRAVRQAVSDSRHDIVLWRRRGESAADTRCFAFHPDVFTTEFEPWIQRIDDSRGYYIEHAAYDFAVRRGAPVRWLRGRPILTGLSGTSGEPFRTSLLKRAAIHLASLPTWRSPLT